jgi:hypothetical protein
MKQGRSTLLFAFTIAVLVTAVAAHAQEVPRPIHVFVALCDNESQGIVPVPAHLGDGDDPDGNLYWGALYGVRSFFKKSDDWKLVASTTKTQSPLLERCIFRHKRESVYLVADAYKGSEIRRAVTDFLNAAAGRDRKKLRLQMEGATCELKIRGLSDLVVYVGHNGLMDFTLSTIPEKDSPARRDAIILACLSKEYFEKPLRKTGAEPLLWTTGRMAPEAYTLKAAIDGWILHESPDEIRLRAARAYDEYQKCGLAAAARLFAAGW